MSGWEGPCNQTSQNRARVLVPATRVAYSDTVEIREQRPPMNFLAPKYFNPRHSLPEYLKILATISRCFSLPYLKTFLFARY